MNDLVKCACAQCGRIGKTKRPRPDFLCVKCYVEKKIGRPLTKDDISVRRTDDIKPQFVERNVLVAPVPQPIQWTEMQDPNDFSPKK